MNRDLISRLSLRNNLILGLAVAAGIAAHARAGISPGGDYNPADTSTWDSTTTVNIGYTGTGSLLVTPDSPGGGPALSLNYLYIGHLGSADGTVVLDGATTPTHSVNFVTVGESGKGSLSILNGAKLSSSLFRSGYSSGSSGTILIDGAGSQLSVEQTGNSVLYVGDKSAAYMTVQNGGAVRSMNATIGAFSGPASVVKVIGNGTTWTNLAALNVSGGGKGSMYISNGADVASNTTLIANASNTTGKLQVDGAGTTLTNSSYIYVGQGGSGVLQINNGAAVSASSVTNYANGLITMDIGKGSTLTIGNGFGSLTNSGKVRLSATALTATGNYTPIAASSITNSGAGTIEGYGGYWDFVNRRFVVSGAATNGTAGNAFAVGAHRAFVTGITDDNQTTHLSLSFQYSTSGENVNARLFNAGEISSLDTLLTADESYLTGWNVQVTRGVQTNVAAYVSMEIGAGYDVSSLHLWHYDGTTWTSFTPGDLSYDGTYASFTVSGFSGYAITAVPEPASLTALTFGVTLLLRRRR